MVDPGSAIGVVSLGIQVAQGLVKYYSNFKAYDDDISHAVKRTERLHSTLAALEVTLQEVETNGDSVSERARISICDCEHELLKLGEVVKTCAEAPAPTSMAARMKLIEKRLAYPFRKGTLRDVIAWVDRAQADLDTAIQALQLKVIVEAKEKATNDAASLDRQIAVVQQHQISAMDTTEIQHKILHTHLQHESAVVTRIDSNVEKSLRQQDQMAHQMSTLIHFMKAVADQRPLTQSPPGDGVVVAQTLQTVAEAVSAFPQQTPSRNSAIKRNRTVCTCSDLRHRSPASRIWNNSLLFWQTHSTHELSCPLHPRAQRIDRVGTRVRYNRFMFAYIVEATMNYTRDACTFSISPELNVKRVVTHENPAWKIIAREWAVLRSHQSAISARRSVERIKRGIEKCFHEGSATPTDTTEFGESLLFRVCKIIPLILERNGPTSMTLILDLLKFLIDAGVPVHGYHTFFSRHLTPLDILIIYGEGLELLDLIRLCSYLVDQGCTWSQLALSALIWGPPTYKFRQILLSSEDVRRGFEGDAIQEAILYRSARQLQNALTKSAPSLKQSRRILEYIPLAADWADGLRILLPHSRLLNVLAGNGLYGAYRFENWECVELLLEEGYRITEQLLEWAVRNAFSAAIRHMVKTLSQDLNSPTDDHQPPLLKGQPHIQPDRLFNLILNVEACDALYNSGFHTIDSEWGEVGFEGDYLYSGTTPLWNHAQYVLKELSGLLEPDVALVSLGTLQWLISKKVRRSWIHPYFGTTPGHLLATNPLLIQFWRMVFIRIPERSLRGQDDFIAYVVRSFLSQSYWNFYVQVLSALERDRCRCACSSQGCLPITCASKFLISKSNGNLVRIWDDKDRLSMGKAYQQMRAKSIDQTLIWLDTLLSTSFDMANATIRVLTFEKLGIRHTCHEVALSREWRGRSVYSPDDIDELHEEDAELISQLDKLTTEFEVAYAASEDPSFYAFYKGYWTTRMNEVSEEMDVVTADYVRIVQNMGVNLKPIGPVLPPNFERCTESG